MKRVALRNGRRVETLEPEESRPMAGKNVRTANDLSFEDEVVKSEVPVLVDFTATWCGPCRTIAPFLDQLADEYEGRVKVVKVDIDESPATAQKYAQQHGFRGVPTLFIIKGGEVLDMQTGARPKAQIEALMKRGL
jgi:thioredoxin 1